MLMDIGYDKYQKKSTPIVPKFPLFSSLMQDDDSQLPNLKTQAERLAWSRARFFSSSRAAALSLGWNENTYKSHETAMRAKEGLKTEDLKKYAKAFKVPVEWLTFGTSQKRDRNESTLSVSGQNDALQKPPFTHNVKVLGVVEAGAWREMHEDEEVKGIIDCDLPEYRHIDLFAHRVAGNSMNKVFAENGAVIYGSVADLGLQDNDFVVVRRRNTSGLYELTVKQLVEAGDGTDALWPRSTDPKWQTPLVLPPRDEYAQEGIEIIGVVVDYRPARMRRSGVPFRQKENPST